MAVVAPPVTNADSTLALIAVVPKTGPDARATTDLVHRLRDNAPTVDRAGGTLYIAGTTAAAIDVSGKLSDALPLFIAIIVILALILLTVAFRSLLVPVKAALGFLLSVAASLGATVWVFQDGHLNGILGIPSACPVTSFLPVLLIGVLFGLAMDYEVFLVSRMREHYEHSGDAAEAVVQGVARSGRVVSAAALIMVAVFGGFVFNHDPIIKSIGFALAFGVLVDAFVVRMTLVPAAMALLGRRAWGLPGWLDRITPDVDIEGAKLPGRSRPQRQRQSQGELGLGERGSGTRSLCSTSLTRPVAAAAALRSAAPQPPCHGSRGQHLRPPRSSNCSPSKPSWKPRSCDTMTTAPGYAASAARRSSTRSSAMWLVGSSRTRRSTGRVTRRAICSRRCCPADRAATGTRRSSSRNRPSARSCSAYSSGGPGRPAANAVSSGSRVECAGSSCAR